MGDADADGDADGEADVAAVVSCRRCRRPFALSLSTGKRTEL